MKHLSFHSKDGARRLYIHGDLQFDERDERLYHEPLALLPVALAARRAPSQNLRVLILGGGDGLALREVLRFSQVSEVRLVDKDPLIIEWAINRWPDLNRRAFDDPRVQVISADIRSLPQEDGRFEVILMDLTYPRELESMAVFSVAFFRQLRRRLSSRGVFALNAVSPELTPAAFGCLARTLQEAGFNILPYSIEVPSFREEGYGRWGFLFGSSEPLTSDDILTLALPDGHGLSEDVRRASLLWPQTPAFAACANNSYELHSYLAHPIPIAWRSPWATPVFETALAITVPRLTVSQGFTNWLKGAEGSCTFQDLITALPLPHQSALKDRLSEDKESLEIWLRQIDWKAFVDASLEREKEWPELWRAELTKWRRQADSWSGHFESILLQSYRVLAILLITLLLANLLFPDNLYAKGFSSHYGGGPSFNMTFTSADRIGFPYRHRYGYGGRGHASVYDSSGKSHDRLLFTQSGQTALTPLALSAVLQLLEDGSIAYATSVPNTVGHLVPGRFSLRTPHDENLLELGLEPALQEEIRRQIEAQRTLLKKAQEDHERWLEWIGWAGWTATGREALQDREVLARWSRLIEQAGRRWSSSPLVFAAEPQWLALIPGIYLDISAPEHSSRALVLFQPDGRIDRRAVPSPASPDPVDQALVTLVQQTVARAGGQKYQRFLPADPASKPQW